MFEVNEKLYVLPMLQDLKEAIKFLESHKVLSDSIRSYVCGLLHKDYGLKNREIRPLVSITKVYTMTHLIRVGTVLTEEEFLLWHNNSKVITLGHQRVLCALPSSHRIRWMREVLARRMTVKSLHDRVRGNDKNQDMDVAAYENEVSDSLGRPVRIEYSRQKETGALKLTFFGLDDLEEILSKLGYSNKSDF